MCYESGRLKQLLCFMIKAGQNLLSRFFLRKDKFQKSLKYPPLLKISRCNFWPEKNYKKGQKTTDKNANLAHERLKLKY